MEIGVECQECRAPIFFNCGEPPEPGHQRWFNKELKCHNCGSSYDQHDTMDHIMNYLVKFYSPFQTFKPPTKIETAHIRMETPGDFITIDLKGLIGDVVVKILEVELTYEIETGEHSETNHITTEPDRPGRSSQKS